MKEKGGEEEKYWTGFTGKKGKERKSWKGEGKEEMGRRTETCGDRWPAMKLRHYNSHIRLSL